MHYVTKFGIYYRFDIIFIILYTCLQRLTQASRKMHVINNIIDCQRVWQSAGRAHPTSFVLGPHNAQPISKTDWTTLFQSNNVLHLQKLTHRTYVMVDPFVFTLFRVCIYG